MSQSLAGNAGHPLHSSQASLSALDIAVAVILHLLAFTLILMFGLWQRQTQEFHPVSVTVHLISAHQLKRMQRHAHHARPVKKHRHKLKIKPKPKLKPVLKLKKRAKPAIKPKVKDNFDPFKPMQSTSDTRSPAHVSPAASQVFRGQLSKQEINHYIAQIQAAVQRHWKVPNISKNAHDPLVEMVLNPGGSVRSVRILQSSGNAALDASLVRAIESASPFQVPQKQFELFRNNKIRFHPLH